MTYPTGEMDENLQAIRGGLQRLEDHKVKTARRWRPLAHQVPPPGDWLGWLMLAGRGAGKTEACAHYVVDHVNGPSCTNDPMQPHWIAIIAPTQGDAVTACFQGPSGIRHFDPLAELKTLAGGLVIRWPNGSQAKLYGCREQDDVERLRAGGNVCLAWLEELSAWRYLKDAFDQMRFGLREGKDPRWIGSTTPKPRPLIKDLAAGKFRDVVITHATMYDNPHLPEHIKEALEETYTGTAIGSQELYGRLVEQDENALWTRQVIGDHRLKVVPEDLKKISVGVDPSGGAGEQGIVVDGYGTEWLKEEGKQAKLIKHGYVLDDRTVTMSPEGWGRAAVQAAVDWEADTIVVETNFGGDMAVSTLTTAAEHMGVHVPIKTVRASRGKQPRAQPVSAMSVQGRWHFVGQFPELEDQLCVVAGSMILTEDGEIPIEKINVGTKVWTRIGWRRVTWAGQTGVTNELINLTAADRTVRCTPNHPVWVVDHGFIPAVEVQLGYMVSTCQYRSNVSSSSIEVSSISPKINIGAQHAMAPVEDVCFMWSSMKRPMVPSLPDIMSTTRIMTNGTTRRQTLSRLLRKITNTNTRSLALGLLVGRVRVPSVGLNGKIDSQDHSLVENVAASFNPLLHTPTTALTAVHAVVTEIVRPTPVYNLTVDDQPEFYANGILIHNCTWTTDSDWSPDRLDAMVWPAWQMGLVSTVLRSVGSFAGSAMVSRTITRRRA